MEVTSSDSSFIGVRYFSSRWFYSISLLSIIPTHLSSRSITPSMATKNCDLPIPLIGRIYELHQSVQRTFGVVRDQSIESSLPIIVSLLSKGASITTTSWRKGKSAGPKTWSCPAWKKRRELACTIDNNIHWYESDAVTDQSGQRFLIRQRQIRKTTDYHSWYNTNRYTSVALIQTNGIQ